MKRPAVAAGDTAGQSSESGQPPEHDSCLDSKRPKPDSLHTANGSGDGGEVLLVSPPTQPDLSTPPNATEHPQLENLDDVLCAVSLSMEHPAADVGAEVSARPPPPPADEEMTDSPDPEPITLSDNDLGYQPPPSHLHCTDTDALSDNTEFAHEIPDLVSDQTSSDNDIMRHEIESESSESEERPTSASMRSESPIGGGGVFPEADPEDEEDEEEQSDDDLFFPLFRHSRHRKVSSVQEPHPYAPPPLPVHDWRAHSHLCRLRTGQLSPAQFARQVHRSQHFVQRLEKQHELVGHQGCVNTLHFNQSGSLLASAGDDLDVIVWDWFGNRQRLKYSSGHHSNIFQAKFLPHCSDRSVVTCARDGQVRVASLSSTGAAYTSKLAQHRLSAHKVALLPDSPCELLSSGEDGVVYPLDIRVNDRKATPLVTVLDDKDRPIELYAVDANPANTHQFLVCGRNPQVRVYDRRRLLHRTSHGDALAALACLQPDTMQADDYRMSVSCAVYSHCGREILASYNDDDIYLFPLLEEERGRSNGGGGSPFTRFAGHRNSRTVKGVSFMGPGSEWVVSGSDDGHVYVWSRATARIVQWLVADEAVANVCAPHPTFPFLAVSGIDHTVKLFGPSASQVVGRPIPGLATTIAQNAKERESDPVRGGTFDARMLMLLMQSINGSERRAAAAAARQADGEDGDAEEVMEDEDDDEVSHLERRFPPGCRTS